MSTVDDPTRRLILSCQGLVKAIAVRVHSNAPRCVELDDLIGYGEVGLAEAARDFDPERGVQFTTFAYYRIRGAIYDGFAKMTWPTRASFSRFIFQRNAGELLECESANDSGDDDSLELQSRRLHQVTGGLFVAYLASHVGPDGDGEFEGLGIEDTSAVPPSVLASRRENGAVLHQLIKTLPAEAHQLIYSMYFEGQDLTSASERLGISKSWASRLHARTLDRLASSLRRMGVGD
jgi:RNA polymerase sigma factor for flagellar operon FliA